MTPMDFIQKWKPVTLSERSAYQQHFLDLCELLDQQKPAEVDPTGTWFTFEKGLTTNRRRQRLRRRLEARLLRLGIQGQAQGPDGRLSAAPAIPRGPGEPAAPGRLRPRPLRDPHQLHRHDQAGPRLRPRRPGRPGEPQAAPERLHRPRRAQARHDAGTGHGRDRRAVRQARRRHARPRRPGRRCRPLPDEADVLHVRRGHRPVAPRPVHPHRRRRQALIRPGFSKLLHSLFEAWRPASRSGPTRSCTSTAGCSPIATSSS